MKVRISPLRLFLNYFLWSFGMGSTILGRYLAPALGSIVLISSFLVPSFSADHQKRDGFGSSAPLIATLLVPNVGEQKFLENMVNKTAPENLTLKLYKSNTTPGETDTASTYTVATFTGYSNVTLTGSSWNAATAGAPSFIDYAQQSFTSSADQTTENIYGYYIIGGTDTVLRLAERFSDAPNPITNNGDIIKITPKITLD